MKMLDMKRLYRQEQKSRIAQSIKTPMSSLKEFIRSKADEIKDPSEKLRDILGLPNPKRDERRKTKANWRRAELAKRRSARRTKAATKTKKPKKEREDKSKRRDA